MRELPQRVVNAYIMAIDLRWTFTRRFMRLCGVSLVALATLLSVAALVAAFFSERIEVKVSSFPGTTLLGGEPDDIVVLVHGTFAPNADWTQPDSSLVAAIRNGFVGRRVQFVRLDWLGYLGGVQNNTHFHRYAAGTKLAELLRTLQVAHPGVRIHVVAHSHGGNVALYATRIEGGIQNLVTMGTPFIEFTPRDLDTDIAIKGTTQIAVEFAFLLLMVSSTALSIACACSGAELVGRCGWSPKLLGTVLFIFSLSLFAWQFEYDGIETRIGNTSVSYPGGGISSIGGGGQTGPQLKFKLSRNALKLRDSMSDRASLWISEVVRDGEQSIANRLSARIPSNLKMLCVRTVASDEALILLDKIVPALGLPGTLLASSSVAFGIVFVLVAGCIMVGVWQGSSLAVFAIREARRTDGRLELGKIILGVLTGGFYGYCCLIVALAVSSCVVLVIAPLSVALRVPAAIPYLVAYGSADIAGVYLAKVEARAEPSTGIGRGRCEALPVVFTKPVSLDHSEYYQDQETIAAIARWLAAPISQPLNP